MLREKRVKCTAAAHPRMYVKCVRTNIPFWELRKYTLGDRAGTEEFNDDRSRHANTTSILTDLATFKAKILMWCLLVYQLKAGGNRNQICINV